MKIKRSADNTGWRRGAALSLALASCAPQQDSAPPDPRPVEPPPVQAEEVPQAASSEPDLSSRLAEVLAGSHRSPEHRARDAYRHPAETLAFFGVTPQSTVVELWPGGGWYTEILAPLLRGSGELVVTNFDVAGPEKYYGTRLGKQLREKLAAAPGLYDQVAEVTVAQDVTLDGKGEVKAISIHEFALAPAGSVDVVLTFRNSHGWFEHGNERRVYGLAFAALKPGGVLGVVQHRAAEGADPKQTVKRGYLPEAEVIAAAEAVGFTLAGSSEINANPKDTRDYAKGVWTLPPRLSEGDKDRERFLAIGESDRMTLKFVKP
ncbi:MAG: class I SAM-dependent methyltransferase [Myxococcales bacterium]|nr:class I SAM-dependent methyltransferase [Myxococcales bacterium]